MDREGELYKSDVDDPSEICPEAIEAADLIDDAIELARVSGNWEGTYTSIMATVDNAIRKANSIPPKAWDKLVDDVNAIKYPVQPTPSDVDYAIEFAKGVRGPRGLEDETDYLLVLAQEVEALRAQLAERTREGPHGYIMVWHELWEQMKARAALDGNDSK